MADDHGAGGTSHSMIFRHATRQPHGGWFNCWRARRHGRVPRWLYPKLIERAYKLVEDPSTPYRLAGAAGGNACARRYLGKDHPIHKIRLKMLNRRKTMRT
jgi:hypothetical protein